MRSFTKKTLAALFLLATALSIAVPATAQAATSNTRLSINRTYTKYDITGDKKADRLRISASLFPNSDIYNTYSVHINGKKVLSKKWAPIFSFDLRRIQLKNGKVYLAIIPLSNNGDIPDAAIYQYKNGRLQKAVDLDAMSKIGYHNHVHDLRVSGNKISVKYGVMSYSLGSIGFTLDYQYKNGKMTQTTTRPKLTDHYLKYIHKTYWTANHSMKMYKKPNGKQISTLKKGQQAKIDRVYINQKHDKIYLHVKTKNGRSGWVKGLTSYPATADKPFQEIQYAG